MNTNQIPGACAPYAGNLGGAVNPGSALSLRLEQNAVDLTRARRARHNRRWHDPAANDTAADDWLARVREAEAYWRRMGDALVARYRGD